MELGREPVELFLVLAVGVVVEEAAMQDLAALVVRHPALQAEMDRVVEAVVREALRALAVMAAHRPLRLPVPLSILVAAAGVVGV